MDRIEEIKSRFGKNEPFNLSAVRIEAPHLLEGLWEPEQFVGWRGTLEGAGLSVENVRILPGPVAFCPLCGWHGGPTLTVHLAEVHHTDIHGVRRTHPAADGWCEEWRAIRMGERHAEKSLTLTPHWEPAWSKGYALDRLHWLHQQRHPVNYAHIAHNGNPVWRPTCAGSAAHGIMRSGPSASSPNKSAWRLPPGNFPGKNCFQS